MNNCIFFRQIKMKMSPKKNSCHFNQMAAVFSRTFADLFCKLNNISRNYYLDIAVDSTNR